MPLNPSPISANAGRGRHRLQYFHPFLPPWLYALYRAGSGRLSNALGVQSAGFQSQVTMGEVGYV